MPSDSQYPSMEMDDEASPSMASDHADDKGMEHDEDDSPTALIPKTLFAGKPFEVGDEITLSIVALHDDEAEVKYATGKGGKEDATMKGAKSKLGDMAEEDGY